MTNHSWLYVQRGSPICDCLRPIGLFVVMAGLWSVFQPGQTAADEQSPRRSKQLRANATAKVLRIRAVIDGRDELRVSPAGATWNHLEFAYPTDIELNGVKWNPNELNRLENSGERRFMPDGVSFTNFWPIIRCRR
jgi:hypothetical protein